MREQSITMRKAVHMIFRRLAYGFKEGLKNIFRNKIFSLATVGTIMACIFLLGVTFSVLQCKGYGKTGRRFSDHFRILR